METRADALVLWFRALFVAGFAFLLGVVGHTMADGLLPGPVFLTVLFVFSVLLAVPLLTHWASPVRLVALLVGGQTFIHLCLTLTAGHRGEPSPLATNARPHVEGFQELPVVDGRRVGSLQDAYVGTSGQAPTTPSLPIDHLVGDLQAHAPMMVAHLAAAALVALWLAHGERLLWTLLTLTGRSLAAALVRPVVPVTIPALSSFSYLAHRAPRGPRSVWLVRPDSRRGPPLPAA